MLQFPKNKNKNMILQEENPLRAANTCAWNYRQMCIGGIHILPTSPCCSLRKKHHGVRRVNRQMASPTQNQELNSLSACVADGSSFKPDPSSYDWACPCLAHQLHPRWELGVATLWGSSRNAAEGRGGGEGQHRGFFSQRIDCAQ